MSRQDQPGRPAPASEPAPQDGAAQGDLPLLSPRHAAALERFAPHVQAALRVHTRPRRVTAAGKPAPSDYVLYEDRRAHGAPPPPPRKPVYILLCDDKGRNCRLRSLASGRVRPAGTLFAGFVRMQKGGPIYVSPRTGPGIQGDSHPTIASTTPEWSFGMRALVAAGEVGIVDNTIVGHNDKTGHFQTRRNRLQSGLPPDRYYPYTVNAREWYRK